jgi:hypothetical protein
VEHERRYADAREDVSKIGLSKDAIEVQCSARASVESLAGHEPIDWIDDVER